MDMINLVHHGFRTPTKEAADLKNELEKHGVKVYVELSDGHKHIDLALPEAKLNIEVDGIHHLTNPRQIVADLARGYYSNKLADALAEASKIREQKIQVHLTK